MILAFEDMAYNTPVGELSPVFRTQFGYHVLKITGRRQAEPEIRAAHILIRLAPDAPEADSVAAYQQMASIQARLAAGEDFGELARAVSQDPGSAQRDGDLGFFSRDRMVAPFADAAYALAEPGDRSDIVRSQFGLHLIELTERQAPASYEEQYDSLKRLAERLPRTQARRAEIGRTFRADAGSHVDTSLVQRATAQFEAESGFAAYSDSTFATIGSRAYTLDEFAEWLRENRINPQADQPAQLLNAVDSFLDQRGVELAADQLEYRNPEFRRIMADYANGVLLFRLAEDSVWNAASRDTVGLRAFYEGREDRYRFPERRRVVGLYSRSDSLLQVAGNMIDGGTSIAEIVEALRGDDERPALRADTLHLSSRTGGLFDRPFDLEVGEYAPPARNRGEFVMLYLDGIEEPRVMTFEEARAQVVADYQDELEKRLVERLRREAGVTLYPEHLVGAFAGERQQGMTSQTSSL